MKRTDVVRQIKKTIQDVEPTAETILFGSEARGDARVDSDIDVLVLLDGENLSFEREERVTMPLYMLELQSGVAISPIVMLRHTWNNRPFKTPFYINIVNEGIAL